MGEPKFKVEGWTKAYSQDGDTCSAEVQDIEIEQVDGGGGPYWVIKTDRWAIDYLDELVDLLKVAGVEAKKNPC